MNQFTLEDQLTIVSTKTLHELFKEKNGVDAVSLYMFYYYTAKWQKTNQVKATEAFIMKGLGWGERRIRRAKKILKTYKLIEDLQTRKSNGTGFGKWYIKINYLWKQNSLKHINEGVSKSTDYTDELTRFNTTNALSDINRNALSDNNISLKNKKPLEEHLPLTDQHLSREQLFNISVKKNIRCPTVIKKYYAIRDLIEGGEFKPKWGKNLNLILQKWISMDINRGELQEMDDMQQNLNMSYSPERNFGKDLFDRAERARKEGKI